MVERLFQRLNLAFGNQIAAKWEGLDMKLVYEDWAESLSDFSLGAIGYAIEKARSMKHPPNQGEFRELCREYKSAEPVLQLPRKFTPEEKAKNRERIADISKMLASSKAMQKSLESGTQ